MKTIDEYMIEKSGMNLKAQRFAEEARNIFDYRNCRMTDKEFIFEDVTIKKPIMVSGKERFSSGSSFDKLMIKKNGWLTLQEDGMNISIPGSSFLDSIFNVMSVDNVHGTETYPVVSAVQEEALCAINKAVESVKKLSLGDIHFIKQTFSGSLEERIMFHIIDLIKEDSGRLSGTQNGV